MNFVEFTKKNLMNYFIIVTGITAVMAILGAKVDPGQAFGYEVFFSPLIYGAIAVLPSYVFYSKRELTLKQMLFRRILHFVILEVTLLGFGYTVGILNSMKVALALASFVFIVYLFTNVIKWIIDSKTTVEINEGLKRLQG
ncbi:MAG: DUF3021 family protein [Mobilitalea sp.]